MMASAMLRAGAVLDDDWAGDHALAHARPAPAREPGAGRRAAHPGRVTGLLDDQVQTAAAALDAYEATGDREWLAWAERLMERVWRDYWDEAAGGSSIPRGTASGEDGLLPARVKPVQDTPTPSPNGVAGIALRAAARAHRRVALARAGGCAGGGLRRRRVRARSPRRGVPAGARLVSQSRRPTSW